MAARGHFGEVVRSVRRYISLKRVTGSSSNPRTVETETKARGYNERDYPVEVGGSKTRACVGASTKSVFTSRKEARKGIERVSSTTAE